MLISAYQNDLNVIIDKLTDIIGSDNNIISSLTDYQNSRGKLIILLASLSAFSICVVECAGNFINFAFHNNSKKSNMRCESAKLFIGIFGIFTSLFYFANLNGNISGFSILDIKLNEKFIDEMMFLLVIILVFLLPLITSLYGARGNLSKIGRSRRGEA